MHLPAPDEEMTNGCSLPAVGSLQFQVLHTPGHSPGSVCLHEKREALLFCGDLLFAGSVGRTDFPGCSVNDMMESLGKVVELPPGTACFPGHMGSTTIGHERQHNPFLAPFR